MSNPTLTIAVKAARNAGKIILRYIDRLDQITVEQKGHNDFVSEVDRMAEDEIINVIRYHYPDHLIVAEESGGQIATGNTSEVEWIIDPLDGTSNYLHSHPHFAVSIAVRQQGKLQYAVIFDPLRNDLYTASRGSGAQLNGHRIRVTQQIQLERALLASGFAYRHAADFDPWITTFKSLMLRAGNIHLSGCAALDLAYVASGKLDGYWHSKLAPWDIAAGALLVSEAGGLLTDFNGDQDFLENGELIATNRELLPQLLQVLTPKTKRTR